MVMHIYKSNMKFYCNFFERLLLFILNVKEPILLILNLVLGYLLFINFTTGFPFPLK